MESCLSPSPPLIRKLLQFTRLMFCLMAHDTSDSKIEPISEVRAIDVTVYCHNDMLTEFPGFLYSGML